jgi:hypothetical protein
MRTLGIFALAVLASACTISSGSSSRPAPPPPPGPPPAGFMGRPAAPPGTRVVVTRRQPNVAKLKKLKQSRKFCAPEEVAPGTWVKFDCKGYSRARNARPMQRIRSTKKGFVGGNVGDVVGIPQAADLRSANLDGPIKDQGAVGTCTAVSLSTAMDVAIRKAGKNDVVSPLHIWSQYAVPNMGAAGEGTENDVLASEGSWEYDPATACQLMRETYDDCGDAYDVQSGTGNSDPRIQAEKRNADGAGRYKLTSVEEFPSPVDPDEMAAVIAGGDAVWIAFSLDTSAWQSSNMRDGVIPDYNNVGQAGHAVTLVGYRTVSSGKQFLIHNSWGTRWGQGGYGWISANMVSRWTRSAYKISVDGQGGGGGGGGGGGTGGCPAGQSMDRVLNQCAATCPSGSAPSAGVCLPAIPGFPGGGGQQPQNPQNPQQGGQQNPFPFPLPGGFPIPGGGGGGGGQPAPSGGACAAGQVPDGMTGQCSNACPGGSAPIGGMCLPGR